MDYHSEIKNDSKNKQAVENGSLTSVHEQEIQIHSEHPKHETSLGAEQIGQINNFPITNSLLNTWIVVFFLVILGVVLRKKVKLIPRGIQSIFEIIVESGLKLCDSVTGSRDKSWKVFPIVFSFFIFILLNNWMGLLPGIGSIGFIESSGGHQTFVPFFRGGTADLNTTLALALIAVVTANVFGVVTVGAYKHINKFINIQALAKIPSSIRKDPAIVIVNPIKFFVGIVEIVGEVAKVASLSFRLFGNIFAGEVLLSSIAVIFAFGLPIPFMFLEVIVGVIQALIFAMLSLVYFSIAMTDEEH
ncbi:MAG TPA: FoF1 ATP synthase subunit a [Patescibacteria group bacterium]|nr:FoF1 ATP synthase subunit a [Patescibacteria group bacterium]